MQQPMITTGASQPELSFVLPTFNEAGSLHRLYDEIVQVMTELQSSFELIFVDDGSTDDGPELLRELCHRDPRVTLLQFVRNYGKSAAYTAGFEAARGKLVVTMDTDLQDDPAELPKLLAELDRGHDLVVGWKQHRMGNEPLKTLPSRVFNALNRAAFGLSLRDQNSGFRVMRQQVARALTLDGDQYRFLPQLAHLAGFSVSEIGAQHRRRQHGSSKYGPRRFFTGLLDLLTVLFLTRFRRAPLHFFGTTGLVAGLAGAGLGIYVLAMKLQGGLFREHVAAIIVGVMLFMLGFQFVFIGLIGEMLIAPAHARYLLSKDDAHGRAGRRRREPRPPVLREDVDRRQPALPRPLPASSGDDAHV